LVLFYSTLENNNTNSTPHNAQKTDEDVISADATGKSKVTKESQGCNS